MHKTTLGMVFFLFAGVNLWAQEEMSVLVLQGNIRQAEYPVLEKMTKIGSFRYAFSKTSDRTLPNLKSFHILWIGQSEICENAYFFNKDTEAAIKTFVQNGGITITMGQDSDDGRPCEVGWIPAKMVGVERGGTEVFTITNAPEVGDLFKKPNEIKQIHFDDAWTQPDPSLILLATINAGDIGIALLKYGKGAYLVTSIENEDAADAATNAPIMENLLFYAGNLRTSLAVDPVGKAALRWGALKQVASHKGVK